MSVPEPSEKDQPKAAGYYGARRVRKGLKDYLFGRAVVAVVSFAVALLVVRELSIVEYAAYTALSGLLILLMALSNAGIERVIPRYFPVLRQAGAESELRRLCKNLLYIRLACMTLILTLVLLTARWFFPLISIPYQSGIVLAFVVYVAGYSLSLLFSRYLQSLLLQRAAALGMAIEWFVKLAVLGVMIVQTESLSLLEVVWVQGITAFLGCAYMAWALYRHVASQSDMESQGDVLSRKQLISAGYNNYVQGLLGFHANPAGGKLIGSYFLAVSATAGLGFAYAITGALKRNMPSILLLGLIEPSVMAKYNENKDFSQIRSVMSVVFKANVLVLAPVMAWLMLSGESFVAFLTGGKYIEAIWMICVLFIILMLDSHRETLQMLVNALEKSHWLISSNLFSLLFLPVTFLLAINFDVYGLLAGLWLIALSRNMFLVAKLRNNGFDYGLDWWNIIVITFLSVVAGVVGWSAGSIVSGLLGSLLALAITITVFLPLIYIVKPFSKEEKRIINSMVGRNVLS